MRHTLPEIIAENYAPDNNGVGDSRPSVIRISYPHDGRIHVVTEKKVDKWIWDTQTKRWLQIG
jgi:hypothetical protein